MKLLYHETTQESKEEQGIVSTAISNSEGAGRSTRTHNSPR